MGLGLYTRQTSWSHVTYAATFIHHTHFQFPSFWQPASQPLHAGPQYPSPPKQRPSPSKVEILLHLRWRLGASTPLGSGTRCYAPLPGTPKSHLSPQTHRFSHSCTHPAYSCYHITVWMHHSLRPCLCPLPQSHHSLTASPYSRQTPFLRPTP